MGVFKGFPDPNGLGFSGLFGDGTDGTVTLGAGTTTLARDMFYDVLNVPNGSTLNTAGFRVFVRTQCNIALGGAISCDGNRGLNATPGPPTGGAATTKGTLEGGFKGSDGGANAGGPAGDSVVESLSGAGGAGGAGFAGAGYLGGGVTAPIATHGSVRSLPQAVLGRTDGHGCVTITASCVQGGAGGGGGCGDGVNAGGGGGGGGGVVVLAARFIVNFGSITATGGVGGNCSTAGGAGTCGGGGGGGGGTVITVSALFSGNVPTAAGGVGGLGNLPAHANDGVAGSVGTVIQLTND